MMLQGAFAGKRRQRSRCRGATSQELAVWLRSLPSPIWRSSMRPAVPSRIGILLLVCFVSLSGCKRIIEEAIKARQRASDGGAGGLGQKVDEDQALGEKLNGYIRQCL